MQFIKYTLASLTAIFLFIAGSFFLLFLVALGMSDDGPALENDSVLQINLNTQITEQGRPDPFEDLNLPDMAGFAPERKVGLQDLRKAFRAAAEDERIRGIYLETGMTGAGLAQAEELREMIAEFRESGKFVYAGDEIYTETGLLIASAADRIFLNPSGAAEFNGFSSETMFYTGLLEKIGVKAEIFRVGKFKSAVEPLMLKEMSEASREQTASYLNDIYNRYLEQISASRKLNMDSLREIARLMSASNPAEILAAGLVTDTAYTDQIYAAINEAIEEKPEKKINFVSLKNYLKIAGTGGESSYKKGRVAVLTAEGEIVNGKGGEGKIGLEIADELRKLRLDDKVKAVVLRVNSPGGGLIGSDAIWREVKLCRESKPVIASMSDYAASGGYYISMAADSIFAQPNTLTGSIGIFGVMWNAEELLTDKLGLAFDGVKTGDYSDIGMPSRAFSDAERAIVQKQVNEGYEQFTSKAAAGRKISQDRIKELGGGRVWSGRQALENGLVDRLGSLEDAIRAAAGMAGLEDDYATVYYPQSKTFLEELMSGNSVHALSEARRRETLGPVYPLVRQMEKLQNWQGVQVRLPYEISIK